MKYTDIFDVPTESWLRGSCTPSKNVGPLTIRPSDTENHVTLSGMTVSPLCFDEFEISIKFSFPENENTAEAAAIFGFGKKFEWSSVEESPLRLMVSSDGEGAIIAQDNSRAIDFKLYPDVAGQFNLNIKKNANWVEIAGCDGSVFTSAEVSTVGFFSIMAKNAELQLSEFNMESPVDAAPMIAERRASDIAAWKRWRMDCNHETMTGISEYVSQIVDQGLWGHARDISVSPALVNTGEKVTLTFRSDENLAKSKVTLEPDYLGINRGQSIDINLHWQEVSQGRYEATHQIIADVPGNWRIIWESKGEKLTRVFGVIEQGYTVCTLWVGSNLPEIDMEIHKYDLPGDYWIGDWWSPFDKKPEDVLDYIRKYAAFRYRYGDVLVPFVNAGWILPGIPDFNLFEVERDLQHEGFTLIKKFMDELGIGPFDLMGSYTMGHDTPEAARDAGVKGLTSMCVWQNWLDGNDENCWKINHWAAPIVPYYMAGDDFRKVAAGQSIIGFNMGTGSSVRNYSIFCFEGCPTNTAPMRRYTDDGAVDASIHRFYYAADAWLNDAKNNTPPLFVTVALENFGNREEWRHANELAVEYLVKKAGHEKLIFASAGQVADYYLANYSTQPEHVFYQPDVYCGLKPDVKPALLPDRIEFSNEAFHSLHTDGQALPQILWDYTQQWDNPVWDDTLELRVANGLVTPESVVDNGCVPRNVDLSGTNVSVFIDPVDDGVNVSIKIDSKNNLKVLPIALWRLPLRPENIEVECDFPDYKWVKVVDGFTGNLNGLLICQNIELGISEIQLKIQGEAGLAVCNDFMIGDSIAARKVTINGKSCIYLWKKCEENISLSFPVSPKNDIHAVAVDGIEYMPDSNGEIRITFDDSWQKESYIVFNASQEDFHMAAISRFCEQNVLSL